MDKQIVILGAGRVGASVANHLHKDADVTVVDQDGDKLRRLQALLDIKVVQGNASHPSVLHQAGVLDAGLVLAVTANDAVNLVACKLCRNLDVIAASNPDNIFSAPKLVARVRDAELGDTAKEHFSVDHVFFPERAITEYILDSIEHPNCLQVHKFADGRVLLGVVKVSGDKIPTNTSVESLYRRAKQKSFRIVAIYRGNLSVFPDGKAEVLAGDEVFFVSDADIFDDIVALFSSLNQKNRSIFISGGGNIGLQLARSLEKEHKVKILERSRERCSILSHQLKRSLVLHGDATDENLAKEEGFGESDVYCAVTDDDETNVMSSLLAKRMGATKLVVLVNRGSYVDVLHDNQIDFAISPSEVTTGSLLRHIRKGETMAGHLLRRGAAEALEMVLHGEKGDKIIGQTVGEVEWPEGVMPGAVVRNESGDEQDGDEQKTKVYIPHRELELLPKDHIIVFISKRSSVPETIKLLSPPAGFF